MEYMQDAFNYPPSHPQHQLYYQPMPYPVYGQIHPGQLDEFHQHYPFAEYADFMQSGLIHEDFEDVGEVSTRPRLTREQVEVLEAQFQAHPKPNSVVKRQLAMQTKLTLPRVANWFQNRRAKAKQQKKQEEFEITQSMTGNPQWQGEGSSTADDTVAQSEGSASSTSAATNNVSSPKKASSEGASSATSTAASDVSKEAGWASLQRALAAAKAGQMTQQPRPSQLTQSNLAMPPPELPQQLAMPLPIRNPTGTLTTDMSDWMVRQPSIESWSSPQAMHDPPFDFGFDQHDGSGVSNQDSTTDCSSRELSQHAYSVSPDPWQESLPTPKGPPQLQQQTIDTSQLIQSPEFHMPVYSTSRRGSVADDLTANFNSFALVSSSPHPVASSLPSEALRQTEGQIDLAARRKRPRPAALTSASLRSRSYGAMTSASPTFRNGMTPPAHVVRHVKSTGHGLNTRYSGIRKASTAQKSPMNVATFAEAESFNRLMAQQAALAQAQSGVMSSADASMPLLSPGLIVNSKTSPTEDNNMMSQSLDMASQYQLQATQHLTLATTSPPSTPFRSDYMNPGRQAHAIPPVSAPPQYASFPDYTPPYSAGPLTNSSWSDAPLTSPELPNFPSVTYIPALNYSQQPETLSASFQHFVLPSDLKSELSMGAIAHMDNKKTEFFIQEFPNQKEEHAHVAQQLAQQKPKSYVFANSAPSDYDQF